MSQATNYDITKLAEALRSGDVDAAVTALGLPSGAPGAVQVCSGDMIPTSAPDESLPLLEGTEPKPVVADSADRAGLSRRSIMNMIVAGAATVAATPIAQTAAAAVGPVDRRALESYAAWLHMERRLLCNELWPHMGADAEKFVFADNAGFNWHVDQGLPSPSARAATILGLVGVDWRAHEGEHFDIDNGNRPPLPANWPEFDGDLRQALEDMWKADQQIAALIKTYDDEAPDRDDFQEADEDRRDAIERLIETEASSLTGVLAKASALQDRRLIEDYERHQVLAVSLAEDITRLGPKAVAA